MSQYERAVYYARNEYMGLLGNMEVLKGRKDLVELQLERLDPSNPDTKARQSAAEEVSSRHATVQDDLYAALSRLRELLSR
jgi:hypothetical protein